MVPPDETDIVVIEALAQHVSELNVQADGLRHEVERRVKRQGAILAVVSALATVLFIVNIVLMSAVLRGVHDSRASRQAAEQNTAQIKDCITPGGKCYENSQKQQAKAIGELITSIDGAEKQTQDIIAQVAHYFHVPVTPAK